MAEARNNIPSPPGLPLVGNILDIQDEVPIRGMERIMNTYGEIVKISVFGKERIIIASVALLDELCDEKRFWKSPVDALASLAGKQEGTERPSRGLFSANSEDEVDWQQAHRTLMPAFGPLSIQEMFGEMHDVASQLVLKWARMGPSFRIPVTSDFTRLTLDTIALCAMDYRFNSFYQDEMHPFVQAMNSSLTAASDRMKVSSIVKRMMPWDRSAEQIQTDRKYMGTVSSELVQHRRKHPTDKRDLLNAMVNGKDSKTGKTMSDNLISANMVTFLIAGHETTSGLLSFAFLNLLKNPEAYFKAQQEVDHVLGRSKMKQEHLKDLKYIDAVLRETLRLTPTVPAFQRSIRGDNPNDDEPLAGGKYAITRDDRVLCLISSCQRDPKVYGDDANEFKPERMLDDKFLRLPKSAWKPFGTGVRSCIGRAFAWQEAQMAVALILQNFTLRLDDPAYEMKIKQNLTLKPEGFYMHATLRDGITASSLQNALSSSEGNVQAAVDEGIRRTDSGFAEGLKPMTVLYGGNTGTCMSLAQKLSTEARRRGFQADVMEMDAAVETLPRDQPVVAVTSSYEGQPPENAGHFVTWLETMKGDGTLDGVQYSIFGCGHSDWAATYQRIPTLVDSLMEKHGGKRLVARGSANAAKGDMFSDFDTWTDQIFWPTVSPATVTSVSVPDLEIELSTHNRGSYLRQDVECARVLHSERLTAASEPEKRHLEVKLPEGMSYEAGDYLAVLPLNPPQNVTRVQKRFKLPADGTINIKPGAPTFLPTGVTLSVTDLVRGYVELGLPATKKDVQACVKFCNDPEQKATLKASADKDFSLLDLLEKYTAIDLSFSTYLAMLPPLRPRHYSISSSPLASPTTCSITYGIINEAAKSGIGQHIGVAGAYLSNLKEGDDVSVSVRSTNKFFHLPADPTETPIMMFGAGTGIAPFRGFIQERAQQLAAGRKLAPALLFTGCRSAAEDRLYATEMDQWAKAGAIDIRYAFSREPAHKLAAGCRYIGDRMLKDKEEVRDLFLAGAKVFTCGSSAVSDSVGHAALKILQWSREQEGKSISDQEATEWFEERRNERFVVDVFA